jgi:hypothetical protein
MYLINNYFGVDRIEEITLEKVKDFFQYSRTENDTLEFKSFNPNENFDKSLKKILTSICGFLNSEGGLLIWGAPRGQIIQGSKEKSFSGELSFVSSNMEKDWFIGKITDSIIPHPSGILFHKIKSGTNYLYVFEIPKSSFAPHQTENVYYMRLDGHTRPAPHHYIEALFKQITFPKLGVYLALRKLWHKEHLIYLRVEIIIFNLSKLINEYNVNYRILVTNGTLIDLEHPHNLSKDAIYMGNGHIKGQDNTKNVLYYGEPLSVDETISFRLEDLLQNNFTTHVEVMASGKTSPMINSSYDITLLDYRSNDKVLKDRILNKVENRFQYDIIEEKGKSIQDTINLMLE